MKITDQMIRDLFASKGFKLSDGGTDLRAYVYDAARELIALAQEVEPLVFENKQAKCRYGMYMIDRKLQIAWALYLNGVNIGNFDTAEEAEQEAQSWHRKQVLGMLRYGDGD